MPKLYENSYGGNSKRRYGLTGYGYGEAYFLQLPVHVGLSGRQWRCGIMRGGSTVTPAVVNAMTNQLVNPVALKMENGDPIQKHIFSRL